MDYPTIISFYTDNWEYSKYADEMRASCDRLGLKHHIVELESAGNWLQNTTLKPAFIFETLKIIKGPVLWIDVDGSILQKPELLKNYPFDFAAREMIGKRHNRKWHVGTLYFDYNNRVMEFMEAWVDMQQNNPQGSDEMSLDMLWKKMSPITTKLRTGELPPEYFEFLKHLHFEPSDGTIVCHRGSRDESKLEMKERHKE